MEKRIALEGPHLWTRELAREMRKPVMQLLEELAAGDTLVIDLAAVEVFDYSFANEFFGKTLLSVAAEYAGRFVIVENLSTYTRENLTKAMESLGLIILERKGGRLTLLGKVHQADEETFSAIRKLDHAVSAMTLSKQLGINLTAVNERLTKLGKLGLVNRQRSVSKAGREQYEYTAPR
jgi:hypothetical protein